jgi:hypothetical protein
MSNNWTNAAVTCALNYITTIDEVRTENHKGAFPEQQLEMQKHREIDSENIYSLHAATSRPSTGSMVFHSNGFVLMYMNCEWLKPRRLAAHLKAPAIAEQCITKKWIVRH